MSIAAKLRSEATVESEAPPLVEPTTQQDATFERLAALHGGIRVKLYVRDGQPFAYVRERWGRRYEVPAHGIARPLLNNDFAPYDEEDA